MALIQKQLLKNRSFELDPLCTFEPKYWNYSVGCWAINNTRVRTGSPGTQSFGNRYNGSDQCSPGVSANVYPTAIIYQDVACPENIDLEASAWVLSRDGVVGSPCSGGLEYVLEDDARLHLKAYDKDYTLLDEEKTNWMGQNGWGANVWYEHTLSWTTPPGTYYVRFQIDGGDGNNGCIDPETGHTGNAGIYMDDCSLVFIEDDNTAKLNKDGTWEVSDFSEIGITDGLVGYWKFNNESKCWAGSGIDATLNGVTYTSGVKGQGAYFDGTTSNNIDLGDNFEDDSFTLSILAKLEDWGGRHLLWVKWTGYTLEPSDAGSTWRWKGGLYTSSGQEMFNPSNEFSYGEWHHLVLTFDEISLTGKAYVDGEYLGENVFASTPIYSSASSKIGNNTYGSMQGSIDEARYYDRVLTDREIKILYNYYLGNSKMQITQFDEMYTEGELKEV